eukprot:CAMPEP_0201501230 /NCGR_PEP_ID=MMETSP0151_2-20130828/83478_1 /ASSEMBLY_ACC=CAM_ASM_000257 /TAXON_ID=200890 /ORGANISM="Paramoeba atlantica, Strain 621/1 / CCAP 1560/9" /LENGTH=1437 /DNA_ID=CAMNT_0047894721 /DNA_START=71 /DNA_END=4384 /DNA_ORIENTATION=-
MSHILRGGRLNRLDLSKDDDDWEADLRKRQRERKKRKAERERAARNRSDSDDPKRAGGPLSDWEEEKKKRAELREKRRQERRKDLEEEREKEERQQKRRMEDLKKKWAQEEEEEEEQFQAEKDRMKRERERKKEQRMKLLLDDKKEEAKELEVEEEVIRNEWSERKMKRLTLRKEKEEKRKEEEEKSKRKSVMISRILLEQETETETDEDEDILAALEKEVDEEEGSDVELEKFMKEVDEEERKEKIEAEKKSKSIASRVRSFSKGGKDDEGKSPKSPKSSKSPKAKSPSKSPGKSPSKSPKKGRISPFRLGSPKKGSSNTRTLTSEELLKEKQKLLLDLENIEKGVESNHQEEDGTSPSPLDSSQKRSSFLSTISKKLTPGRSKEKEDEDSGVCSTFRAGFGKYATTCRTCKQDKTLHQVKEQLTPDELLDRERERKGKSPRSFRGASPSFSGVSPSRVSPSVSPSPSEEKEKAEKEKREKEEREKEEREKEERERAEKEREEKEMEEREREKREKREKREREKEEREKEEREREEKERREREEERKRRREEADREREEREKEEKEKREKRREQRAREEEEEMQKLEEERLKRKKEREDRRKEREEEKEKERKEKEEREEREKEEREEREKKEKEEKEEKGKEEKEEKGNRERSKSDKDKDKKKEKRRGMRDFGDFATKEESGGGGGQVDTLSSFAERGSPDESPEDKVSRMRRSCTLRLSQINLPKTKGPFYEKCNNFLDLLERGYTYECPFSVENRRREDFSVQSFVLQEELCPLSTYLYGDGQQIENKIQSGINEKFQTRSFKDLRLSWRMVWLALDKMEEGARIEEEKKFEGIEKLAKFQRLQIWQIDRSYVPLPLVRSDTLVGGLARLKSGERLWYKGLSPSSLSKKNSSLVEKEKKKLLFEAMLLSKLRSTHVPVFFGGCFAVPFPFIAMEYVPSFSLESVLRDGRKMAGSKIKRGKEEEELLGCFEMLSPWENRWQLLIDVVVGLSVLHRHIDHPIAHGSFHSKNLLLDKTTIRAKLCGFNNSLSADNGHTEEEVKRGMKEDIRGLGVLMVEISNLKSLGGERERGEKERGGEIVKMAAKDTPEDWLVAIGKCMEDCRIDDLIYFLKKKKRMKNRFVEQKEASKKLKEEIKKTTSEMEIQEQLLEVVERNTVVAENRLVQEEAEFDVLSAEVELLTEKIKKEKATLKKLEEEEQGLKNKYNSLLSEANESKKQVSGGKDLRNLKKKLQKMIEDIEEERDEEQRNLTKVKHSRRQLENQIDSLETEYSASKKRYEKLGVKGRGLSPTPTLLSSSGSGSASTLPAKRTPVHSTNSGSLLLRPSNPTTYHTPQTFRTRDFKREEKKKTRRRKYLSDSDEEVDSDDDLSDLSPKSRRREERKRRLAKIDQMGGDGSDDEVKRRPRKDFTRTSTTFTPSSSASSRYGGTYRKKF